MTREEIDHALMSFNPMYDQPKWVVDFALDMVRRHNEELAKILENTLIRKDIIDVLAAAIREAKP